MDDRRFCCSAMVETPGIVPIPVRKNYTRQKILVRRGFFCMIFIFLYTVLTKRSMLQAFEERKRKAAFVKA